MTASRYDVAVTGAGPVGLAAALALAEAGARVCLIGPDGTGSDGRTAALLAGSVDLLRGLGAWPLLADEAGPLRGLRIVDGTDSLFRPPPVLFRAEEIDLEAFGWNVLNRRLTQVLARLVRDRGEIAWRPEMVEGLETGEVARIRLVGGDTVEAALAVAADGRRSVLREAAGIRTREHRYPQTAFTAILRHSRPHDDVSTEFHTRSGPFTLVPLPGSRSSLVWVTSPHHARRLAASDPGDIAAAVERQAQSLLGSMALDGPTGCVPLVSMSVDRLVGPRLALAGEAAHVLPPIGAQGLNLGFADVDALRRSVGEAIRSARDPGGPAVLAGYERARRLDIRLRSVAVDGLNRALLSGFAPLDAARGLGLGLLGRFGPLRRAVMRAGLPGSTPSRLSPGTGRAAGRRS